MAAVNVSPKTEVISEEDFVVSGEVPIGAAAISSSSDGFPLGPLQRYRIVAPLGKGGMAEVFLAAWEVAPHLQRPVVIKRLYTHLGDDPNVVQMFIDEARLACGFEHQNIVKTIEVGIIEGQCCIAMEYLAGQSLQQLMRQSWGRGGVPVEIAIHVVLRALDALGYAHDFVDHRGCSLGIVHRDISPHNIFVTNNGCVKLLDFGIAKATCQESRTATGYVKGKLAYIAPEQAQSKPVDRRADIWSLGVVLWEMLVGTRLFRAETDAATLSATLGAPIAKPSTLRPEVPPDLDRIVVRSLQRNPALRYQSAHAMKQDLERFVERSGCLATTESVSRLMHECFAEQMVGQQKLVFDLLERDDSASVPATMRTPTAHATQNAGAEAGVTVDLTRVDGMLDQVSRSHRFLVRALLGTLMIVAALASFVIYTLVFRQRQIGSERTVAVTHEEVAPVERRAQTAPSEALQPESFVPATAQPVPATPSVPLKSTASSATFKPAPLYRRATPTEPVTTTEVGMLNLDTTPWSMVTMNGKTLGQTPLIGVKLPVGTHVLTLRNPDLGLETQYSVTIEPGRTTARRLGLQ